MQMYGTVLWQHGLAGGPSYRERSRLIMAGLPPEKQSNDGLQDPEANRSGTLGASDNLPHAARPNLAMRCFATLLTAIFWVGQVVLMILRPLLYGIGGCSMIGGLIIVIAGVYVAVFVFSRLGHSW